MLVLRQHGIASSFRMFTKHNVERAISLLVTGFADWALIPKPEIEVRIKLAAQGSLNNTINNQRAGTGKIVNLVAITYPL